MVIRLLTEHIYLCVFTHTHLQSSKGNSLGILFLLTTGFELSISGMGYEVFASFISPQ